MKAKAPKPNPRRGSSFDDFLADEGILPEVTALALKRVLALQIQEIIDKQHITKSQLAVRMHTSRAAVNRLLDPENASLTVANLGRAAAALGKKVEVRFVPA
jgi:antitoxin HicB